MPTPRKDCGNRRLVSARFALALLLTLLWPAAPAGAVLVQDVVRLKGSEQNKLVGMGLVVGLKGTGDGGKFAPSARALAQVIGRLNDANVVAAELSDSKNVALVTLTADLPAAGVREGDRVDVHISAIGSAKSLEGGRLFMVPLIAGTPDSPVFAYAEGAVTIENAATPTGGVVVRGAQMVRDVRSQLMDSAGRITLVLNEAVASYPVANNLANLVNDLVAPDGPPVAQAVDGKNVVLTVPTWHRANAAAFISPILQTYIDPAQLNTGGKVVINERTGTIVISGDVQISPVIISHKGLTITTLTPPPAPDAAAPIVDQNPFLAVGSDARNAAKLADLLAALNQLKVPVQDRIEILKLMHSSGKLHAELVTE